MKPRESKSGIFSEELQFDLEDRLSSQGLSVIDCFQNMFPRPPAARLASDGVKEPLPSLPKSAPLVISNGQREGRRSLSSSFDDASGLLSGNQSMAGSHGNIDKRLALYKTEICRTFEETGRCKYGDRCQFAHSQSELRPTPRHPRYKTEICRTFWEKGACPYGKRCCFIHNESFLGVPTLSKSMNVDIDAGGIFNNGWNHSLEPMAEASGGRKESRILSRLKSISSSPVTRAVLPGAERAAQSDEALCETFEESS